MPSDTETSISLGSISDDDDNSSSTKSINRFIDDEAEEVAENEEEDEEADAEEENMNDLAQFDDFSFAQSLERESRARSEKSTRATAPAPNMDDDEGFASRALSVDGISYTAASEDDFGPPSLPTDDQLRTERAALEGSTRLSLELRSLELIGLNILRNEPLAQDFLVWLRKLLNVRHSESIRHALITKVGAQMRAAYLYDRVLRRYWSGKQKKQHLSQETQQSADTGSYNNVPFSVYSAETIAKVPLISKETALIGSDLSEEMAATIGNRATGKIIPKNKLSPEPDTEEALVIICATALEIIESEVASGTYAASEGQIRLRAFLAPAHSGMVITGIVKSFIKPNYSIDKPIFKTMGTAIISLGECDVPVEFGAEVPEKSLALGRIWVLKMIKDTEKNYRWCLKFDQDPYLYGGEFDSADVTALTPQRISDMSRNRKETNPREPQNWAASTDKKTGWRCVIQLPETGYWDPENYSDLMGVHNINGVDVHISTSNNKQKRGDTTAVLLYSEHQKGKGKKIKTSQRCTLRLTHNRELYESVVSVPHLKNQTLASKFLARKTARCIEVIIQMHQSGISPKAGTLSFVEGKLEHDDDLSLIEEPPIKRLKPE